MGLWGTSVHRNRTREWAVAVNIPAPGAEQIADWDEKVDDDFSTTTFTDSNWSWHFDRSNGGPDSRLEHASEQLGLAEGYCTAGSNGKDDARSAAKCLGRALHPLQDWVAHGDFNRRREAPHIASVPWYDKLQYAHNKLTTQEDRGWKTVDDPAFDSSGPNGRATFSVMNLAQITSYGDRLYWATFNTGSKRIVLTETKTREVLNHFTDHVRTESTLCGECRKTFLGKP